MWRQYTELPRSVHILCLGTFINRAGSFFVVFLTIYLSKELGYGTSFATTCMGAFGMGAIVASLVGGALADRIGRRPVMLISLFGGSLVLAVFGFLRSKAAIVSATILFALVIDMYRPAASAMIADLVRPDQRSQSFGLMYVSINLGFAGGAFLGGQLASLSFMLLFIGDAATTCACAIIILIYIVIYIRMKRSGRTA